MVALTQIQVWGPPGTRVSIAGREFEIIRREPHKRQDGTSTLLTVWSGDCAECGASFEQTVPTGRLPGNRRCQEHRAPGRRVQPAEPAT